MVQTKHYQYMLKWANERPDQIFLRQIINRKFKDFSYQDVVNKAQKIVTALNHIGCKPGDKIGLISKNCAEWFIADLAMVLGSFISVPIFPTANTENIKHALTHSECKALFVGKLDDTKAISSALISLPTVISISLPYPNIKCQFHWDDLLLQHEPSTQIPEHNDDDLMSIVYTSGTSGAPKGAMLSYGAFAWSINQLIQFIDIKKGERLFSYLPLAHITERVYIMGCSMMEGICVAFPESLDTFIDDVKMQRPTLFISVPHLWGLFQQRIQSKLPESKLNILLSIPFVSNLIKKKIISNLGLDKARVLGCGSAPVSESLLRWFDKLNIHITQAWGMTESFAYSTLNYPFQIDKIATVGKAAPGIEMKLAIDGEVLIKSDGLFLGYYKDQKATEKMILNQWLYTGDIGSIDKDGYLTLLGRKNDAFKTAKGKYVNPSPIEKNLQGSGHFEMLCLVGSGLPNPILLVIPHQNITLPPPQYELIVKKTIDSINENLEPHAKIGGVFVIKEAWSIENGMLTPTLKIKRHTIEAYYQYDITNWPDDKFFLWEI